MAFKKTPSAPSAPESPADFFRTFTRRTFPDVMPHQRDILRDYGNDMVGEHDVALQLPTGSGKTLVGLLIAEWRRRKFGERVVYLCPTKQLVNQTVEQAQEKYGIDVNGFTGSKHNYPATAKADYTTGEKLAVATYSSLFNTSPFFQYPDIVIIDDVHAAENYIAEMWSLRIPANDEAHAGLYSAIISLLRPHLTPQSHTRLTGNWTGPSDTNWVDKFPSIYLQEIAQKLTAIIDTYSQGKPDLNFSWKVLRDHLDSCHVYLSSHEILIRPLIPPTWTHEPFANAKQRLYMSATLGAGGDLERLTGIASITRLPAPEGFRSTSVGRRFFIFPGLSLEPEDCNNLRLEMQKIAGRSVVLTTNHATAETITEQVKTLEDFATYDARDIEASKASFIEKNKAAAIMAARFDGIDFPDDECRLLCLDGLPKATNAQERFLMTKMGATALFNERLQTRVLQAAVLEDYRIVRPFSLQATDFVNFLPTTAIGNTSTRNFRQNSLLVCFSRRKARRAISSTISRDFSLTRMTGSKLTPISLRIQETMPNSSIQPWITLRKLSNMKWVISKRYGGGAKKGHSLRHGRSYQC